MNRTKTIGIAITLAALHATIQPSPSQSKPRAERVQDWPITPYQITVNKVLEPSKKTNIQTCYLQEKLITNSGHQDLKRDQEIHIKTANESKNGQHSQLLVASNKYNNPLIPTDPRKLKCGGRHLIGDHKFKKPVDGIYYLPHISKPKSAHAHSPCNLATGMHKFGKPTRITVDGKNYNYFPVIKNRKQVQRCHVAIRTHSGCPNYDSIRKALERVHWREYP